MYFKLRIYLKCTISDRLICQIPIYFQEYFSQNQLEIHSNIRDISIENKTLLFITQVILMYSLLLHDRPAKSNEIQLD